MVVRGRPRHPLNPRDPWQHPRADQPAVQAGRRDPRAGGWMRVTHPQAPGHPWIYQGEVSLQGAQDGRARPAVLGGGRLVGLIQHTVEITANDEMSVRLQARAEGLEERRPLIRAPGCEVGLRVASLSSPCGFALLEVGLASFAGWLCVVLRFPPVL